jgi:hypothetical protein
MPETEKARAAEPAENEPVVIDLGKKSRKRVRALRRGEGPLLADVNATIKELQLAGTVSASAQPVIVVVRQKSRKRGRVLPF